MKVSTPDLFQYVPQAAMGIFIVVVGLWLNEQGFFSFLKVESTVPQAVPLTQAQAAERGFITSTPEAFTKVAGVILNKCDQARVDTAVAIRDVFGYLGHIEIDNRGGTYTVEDPMGVNLLYQDICGIHNLSALGRGTVVRFGNTHKIIIDGKSWYLLWVNDAVGNFPKPPEDMVYWVLVEVKNFKPIFNIQL